MIDKNKISEAKHVLGTQFMNQLYLTSDDDVAYVLIFGVKNPNVYVSICKYL